MLIHLNYTAARKNKYGKFHVCAMEINTGIMEAIAEHDSRPKWFIGMVCTKEFGIFIFSGGVSFTKISLFQPDPYKNVRNPTQIVIYFDGRKSLTFL